MHYNYTNDIPCNHSLPTSAQYYLDNVCCHDNHNTVIELAMQRRAAFSWAGQKVMRSLRSRSLRSRDALHLSSNLYNYCERSELPSLFNARIFYIYIYVYIFQAVRRAVNVRNPGHRLQQLRTAREPVFNS